MLLGDYNGRGDWVGNLVAKALGNLDHMNYDETVYAHFESYLDLPPRNYVGTSLLSGRSGITSVLERSGAPSFLRTPEHSEVMRSAVLFHLPRRKRDGVMAIHIPHNRSCKSIIERALREEFSESDYRIEITPIVPRSALLEAVRRNNISKVTLIKHNPTDSDAFLEVAQYGDTAVDRLELIIPSRRRKRLRGDPLLNFLEDPSEGNRRQIIEFAGLTFDDVKITVDMSEGGSRTFHLEDAGRGHPITYELLIDNEDDFGADIAELNDELIDTLTTVQDEL